MVRYQTDKQFPGYHVAKMVDHCIRKLRQRLRNDNFLKECSTCSYP